MAQQEDGWPLGLQPLHMRVGLMRNHDFSGSISFNTLLTASASSSTDFSSDLDTESTGSFFHDKSITLGSLIGVSSILELSGRSARGRRVESFRESLRNKKSYKSRIWLFSLCSKTSTYTENANDPPSLGHFLEVERKAANDYRRSQSPIVYEPYEFTDSRPSSETNSLFVNGLVAPPPQSSPLFGSDVGTSSSGNIEQSNGCGVPVLLSCMCGQPTN